MKFSERRKICRDGEYIVISQDGNTVLVADAANSLEALTWRLGQIDTEWAETAGVWRVTKGVNGTHMFQVTTGHIERLTPEWWDREIVAS